MARPTGSVLAVLGLNRLNPGTRVWKLPNPGLRVCKIDPGLHSLIADEQAAQPV
jgi:hypothetical protein